MDKKGWPLQVAAALCVALLLGIAFFLFFDTQKVGAKSAGESYAPGRVVVQFRPMVDLGRARDFLEEKGYRVLDEIPEWNTLLLEVQPEREHDAIEELAKSPLVGFAERDCNLSLITSSEMALVGGDISLSEQWFASRIGLDGVITRAAQFPKVQIGLIDTGIDHSSQLLKGKVFASNDFTNTTPEDHGTFVAGVIAASAPNAVIRDYGIDSPDGNIDCFRLAKAIHAAVKDRVRVLEIDYGTETPTGLLGYAVSQAYDAGIFVIAPVGSNGVSGVLYPAAYPEVMAVSALGGEDDLASYSNYGPDVDVAAPGGDEDAQIISILPHDRLGASYGTSIAAAQVAVAAAIAIGDAPGITTHQLTNAVYGSCDKVGNYAYVSNRNSYLGFGRINVAAMLRLIDAAEANVTPTRVRVSTRDGGNIPGQVVIHNSSLVRHVSWHASLRGSGGWVELEGPFSGDISPGGSAAISLMVKAGGLEPGNYTATLLVTSDKPVVGLPTEVPIILHVQPRNTPTPEPTPTPTAEPTPTPTAVPSISYSLFLGDDTYQEVDLMKPFHFPGSDRQYTKLWVASNGFVTFQDPGGSIAPYDISCDDAPYYPASVFVWGKDLNPAEGGTVSVDEDESGFTVRWSNVPLYMWDGVYASFQARFQYEGKITVAYQSIPLFLDGMVALVEPDGEFSGPHICPSHGQPGPVSGDVISWK